MRLVEQPLQLAKLLQGEVGSGAALLGAAHGVAVTGGAVADSVGAIALAVHSNGAFRAYSD